MTRYDSNDAYQDTPKLDSLVVFFPDGDWGTQRDVRRYAARRWNVSQSRITIFRSRECDINQDVTVMNLLPVGEFDPRPGRDVYAVVRGVDLVE